MKVKRKLDNKGNVIFEANNRRVYVDLAKIEELSGKTITLFHRDYSETTKRLLHLDDSAAVFYNRKEKLIVNDEGFHRACDGIVIISLSRIIFWRRSNSSLQKKILKDLAHEIGHLSMDDRERKKWWPFRKLLPLQVPLAFGIILIEFFLLFFLLFSNEFHLPEKLQEISSSLLPFLLIPISLISLLLILTLRGYLRSKEEINARSFAKTVLKNPEWQKIVKVTDYSQKK